MLKFVDRCDSGTLTPGEVANPSGWILLSFIMDPRTGLGRYRDYRISNYQLMMRLVDLCRHQTVEEILVDADVAERVSRYFRQEEQFAAMLRARSRLVGKVLLIDLRRQEEIFTGNRFTAYSLFPEANVSVQVIWGKARQNVVLTVGKSIFDRSNPVDIGRLLLSHGGGGHENVGTCQVPEAEAEQVIEEVVGILNGAGGAV
jgi:nanoRNase/pAp phosphatase (c-di-AMP/oligoRNAs hydrolase)